jgi:hypothetical protein
MANATARVGRAVRSYRDEILTHSYGTVTSKTTLYVNAMVGLNAGYLAKFDDTASMTFFGLVNEDEGNPSVPSDGTTSATQGAASLGVDVRQPPAFELAISGVAITDVGRRVYAVDDQTGTLDPSATTYANLIGVVKGLVFAMDGGSPVSGYALVAPIYHVPRGNQLQVLGASGAVVIKPSTVLITKAGVAALTIADPTSGTHDGLEMTLISATAQAHTLDNSAGSGFNAGGAASDVGTFGGAKGDNITIVAYAGKWYVKSKTNVTLA